jgi:hypothetical protein
VTAPRKQSDADRESLSLNWAGVAVAAAVCVLGFLLLWGVWWGSPVAADFSRVGGASRVETALEAARFWLTPPRYVVETQTHSGELMLKAAQCAVIRRAPLLFTSPDPKEQRQVRALIADWRKIKTSKGVGFPHVVTKVTKCLGSRKLTDIAGLSTLKVPNPLIGLPGVPSQAKLAHVVVFAAAIEPGHPPDVAVGLALAAHMARANRENVSLVVVPHYLESDHELVTNLQSQHELVTGGVVLGQTPTVPEETRTLLRQLITARDGHGILAELQDNLGSVGSLIGALLALVGAVATAGAAKSIATELVGRFEYTKLLRQIEGRRPPIIVVIPTTIKHIPESAGKTFVRIWRVIKPVKNSDWRFYLGTEQKVTIWLRSGRDVRGTIVDQVPPNTRNATVFRVKAPLPSTAASSPPGASPPAAPPPPTEERYVLVSVREIERIEFTDSKP